MLDNDNNQQNSYIRSSSILARERCMNFINIHRRLFIILILTYCVVISKAQNVAKEPALASTELVMSMTQRSLVMPGYLTELKALIATQAYNFWNSGLGDPYVSHLNVYSALHYANKYLDFDSGRMVTYNQVGFHSNKVTSIRFGEDHHSYYSASADGSILKWNLDNPKSIPQVIYESDNIIKSLDISGDGELILATFYQTGLALIPTNQSPDRDGGIIEDPEPVQSAIFIPGEPKYLSVSRSGVLTIKGYTNSKSEQVGKTNLQVNELIVDKTDGTIYAGTSAGTLEAWEKPYQVNEKDLSGIIDEIEDTSYFGYALGKFAINCMDLSSDGKLLAIGRERGDVILWNVMNRTIERVISSHQSAITDIDFSPNNELLLTTSRDKTGRIWDLKDSRKLPIVLDDHDDWVYAGAFDPTGQLVITGSGDQYIRTWPVNPSDIAAKICEKLSRDMTMQEWYEFVGKDIPYQTTCNQ